MNATPDTLQSVETVNRTLVARYGGDPAATNIDRLMRLPGTVNYPNPQKRERGFIPCMARVLLPDSGQGRPTLAELQEYFASPSPAKPPRNADNATADPRTLADLRSALAAIPADCGYHDWQRIGSALKSLGDAGRPLFLEWSYRSEKAQLEPRPERKWNQFGADRTGYRAVFAEAKRHGWSNPSHGSSGKRPAEFPFDLATLTVNGKAWQPPPTNVSEPSLTDPTHFEVPQPGGLAITKGITADALMNMAFEPIRYVIPDYFAEGLTVLAGAPKIGKSWLALGIGAAVASGGIALGQQCAAGDVLYLALEDNPRRLQRRLKQMLPHGIAPSRLRLVTEWPSLDADARAADARAEIEKWLSETPGARLVVIDVLAKIRGRASPREGVYADDYRNVAALQMLAGQYGIAIVVVHHTRKMEAADPFDEVSGTHGLTGAADAVLVLKRGTGTSTPTLYGRGRDIEEFQVAMQFDPIHGLWTVIGKAAEMAKTPEQQAILDLLKETGKPMRPTDIANALDKSPSNVSNQLKRMLEANLIENDGKGRYTPLTPITPTTDDLPDSQLGFGSELGPIEKAQSERSEWSECPKTVQGTAEADDPLLMEQESIPLGLEAEVSQSSAPRWEVPKPPAN